MAGGYPCGCCESCTRFSDSFTRDDSDDPGSHYTEEAGDWDISSNALVTIDSNGLLVIDNTDTNEEGVVTAALTLDQAGDQFRIIMDYVDTDNYWFVEFTAGAASPATTGSVIIYERSGGSNTARSSATNQPIGAGATIYVKVCVSKHQIMVCLTSEDGQLSLALATYPMSPVSSQCALGAGTLTGTATFDSLVISKHAVNDSDCEECTGSCGHICNVAYPTDLTVTTGTAHDGYGGDYDLTYLYCANGVIYVSHDGGDIDIELTVPFDATAATPVLISAFLQYAFLQYSGWSASNVSTYLWNYSTLVWDLSDNTWNPGVAGDIKTFELGANNISGSSETKIRFVLTGLGMGFMLMLQRMRGCYNVPVPEVYEAKLVCTTTPALGGTFALDIISAVAGLWSDTRYWEYTYPAPVVCGPHSIVTIRMNFSFESPGCDLWVNLRLINSSGTTVSIWRADVSGLSCALPETTLSIRGDSCCGLDLPTVAVSA